MDWGTAALPAVASALACGLAGLGVPALIGRLPEPEPDPEPPEALLETAAPGDPEQAEEAVPAAEAHQPEEPPKELYADLARLPGLTWKAALAAAVAGCLIGLAQGWSWSLLFLLPLVPVGVALAVIDWRTKLLPIKLVSPTYLLTIVLVLIAFAATRDVSDLVRSGWGFLVAGGLYLVLWFVYPRGMGYGDVRLSGVLGIALGFLGWSQLLTGVYAGFLIGGVGGGLLAAFKVFGRQSFPFGPFMLLGALVGILWGVPITDALVGG